MIDARIMSMVRTVADLLALSGHFKLGCRMSADPKHLALLLAATLVLVALILIAANATGREHRKW